MSIIMIAAAGEQNALGKDNDLLWHLPDDFKRFKNLTTGHPIIMGRKTFESFPKALPNRKHIIITRDHGYKVPCENCVAVNTLDAALKLVENESLAYIIGGGEIYRQAEPFADAIELTRIHHCFPEADTFFPEIDKNKWELVAESHHAADDRHKYSFTYLTYKRRPKP